MGGIAIGVLGVWVLVQVLGGDALGRLGLTAADAAGMTWRKGESSPPGTDWGDVI